MTTLATPSLPLVGLVSALRRSWPAALTEAVFCGVAALLLGSAAIDAEVAFKR